MRVIAGLFKGRNLETVNSRNIRPTSDKVKGALFNIIGDKIINSKFLDLFAGSGNVGIEAFSRGAAKVVFIDSSEESIKMLKKNLSKLGIEEAEVYNANYSIAIDRLSSKSDKFDIIFIDPPYKENISYDVLKEIFKGNILSDCGIIIIEQNKKEFTDEEIGFYKLYKEKVYGNTRLSFYAFSETNREDKDEDMCLPR